MNWNGVTFDRRGRELRLAARPLLVFPRQWSEGSHNNNKTKKPLTQISLQNRPTCIDPADLCASAFRKSLLHT
jgi:hypothetical protein